MKTPITVTLSAKDVSTLHWMARRYADGRSTYAPSLLNEVTRRLLSTGMILEADTCDGTNFAVDGMGDLGFRSGLSNDEYETAMQSADKKLKRLIDALYETRRNGLLSVNELQFLLKEAGVHEE